MSDAPTDSTPTDEADLEEQQSEVAHDVPPDDDADTDDAPPQRNREEGYRKRMRAAETELTLAHARIAELNRAQAEAQLLQHLQDSSDLWTNGVELDDLLGEDMLIDAVKVELAIGELLERKPHLARKRPAATPPASAVTGDGRPPEAKASTWEAAFGG